MIRLSFWTWRAPSNRSVACCDSRRAKTPDSGSAAKTMGQPWTSPWATTMGELEIDGITRQRFVGTAFIGAGRNLTFEQDFFFETNATLQLAGGSPAPPARLHSPLLTTINSAVSIDGTAVMSGNNQFFTNARVDLPSSDGELRIRDTGLIAGDVLADDGVGADFTGQGQIINEPSTLLVMLNRPFVGVAIENSGRIDLQLVGFSGRVDVGSVRMHSFRQTAEGVMQFDVGTLEIDQSLVLFPEVYQVEGAAKLDGALDVRLVEFGENPLPVLAEGDSFEILSADGGVTGQFQSLSLPTAPAGTSWRFTYNPNSVVLDLIPGGPPGDYDCDGVVNAADFVVWRNTLGDVVSAGTAADGDSSGTIDQGDLTVWRDNFGNTATVVTSRFGTTATAIPEPTTWLLLLAATLSALIGHRNQSR